MPYQESEFSYFNSLPRDTPLWRYMSIDKFMYMLSEESLYFSNIGSFNDKSEGTLSSKSEFNIFGTTLFNEKNTPIKMDEAFFTAQNNYNQAYADASEPLDEQRLDYIDRITHRHFSFRSLLREFSNYFMFCCSWFMKNSESHSMWAEYGDKSPSSLAIQTTVGDLIDSLESAQYDIHIGEIKYKDYEKEHIEGYEDFRSIDLTNPENVLKLFYAPIMHKRDIYDDEHEVRAVISFKSICQKYLEGIIYTSEIPYFSDNLFRKDRWLSDDDSTNLMKNVPAEGISVKTNVQTLLYLNGKVVLSPNAKPYFEKPLKKLLEIYNINPNIVHKSRINRTIFI